MLKQRIALALSLASIALAASACSPAAAEPAPGSAESEAPNTATGWELNLKGGAERIEAAGLSVLKAEGHAEHFHAHLDVFVDGKAVIVPADIGFEHNPAGTPTGISALHSHDESGIIHVEAPTAGDTYTLGQFLTEWGVLDGTDKTAGSAHSSTDGWTATVNGSKHDGKITDVVLKAHDQVVLYSGTAPDPMPASFTFPDGL
ncbi:hypothetical protein [Pseudarthrobacter chlorophenolicus]|uniref:hypothetical protein n=1 Tax=Pseudarthrobacter chlorophenolicus TaxID=85085 RepID=UPI000307B3B4|nr:hypothetical protein [Pseudarthrobacter chlorophenolicus]